MRPGQQTMTFYVVEFKDYEGRSHWLHTIDAAKIGPWIAEMFMVWPYTPVHYGSSQIRVETSRVPVPGA